jgi:hypothetical protein
MTLSDRYPDLFWPQPSRNVHRQTAEPQLAHAKSPCKSPALRNLWQQPYFLHAGHSP